MVDKSRVDPKTFTTDYIKSDYDNTSYLGNPHIDAMVLAIQAVGGELWSARRRMYVVESLLEKKIPVTAAAIQGYVPTAEESARWKADRNRMIDGMYAPFLRSESVSYKAPETKSFDPAKEPAKARMVPIQVGKPADRK